MAATAIPEHVAARLIRLRHEAEVALAQKRPIGAIVISNAVLESALEAVPEKGSIDDAVEVEQCRRLRNAAANPEFSEPTLEQAADMVRGVRSFLTGLAPGSKADRTARITVSQLRGKYKYVPTSSTAFIQRKADELGLER